MSRFAHIAHSDRTFPRYPGHWNKQNNYEKNEPIDRDLLHYSSAILTPVPASGTTETSSRAPRTKLGCKFVPWTWRVEPEAPEHRNLKREKIIKKQINKIKNKNNDNETKKLKSTATHTSADPNEEPSELTIGSLQQNLPFKGKGGRGQQMARATSIQPMDHRELRDRHRTPKNIGAASRKNWDNIIHLDSPNSNVVDP